MRKPTFTNWRRGTFYTVYKKRRETAKQKCSWEESNYQAFCQSTFFSPDSGESERSHVSGLETIYIYITVQRYQKKYIYTGLGVYTVGTNGGATWAKTRGTRFTRCSTLWKRRKYLAERERLRDREKKRKENRASCKLDHRKHGKGGSVVITTFGLQARTKRAPWKTSHRQPPNPKLIPSRFQASSLPFYYSMLEKR